MLMVSRITDDSNNVIGMVLHPWESPIVIGQAVQ